MKVNSLLIITAFVFLVGCETIPPSSLSVTKEVRAMSMANDRLFNDILASPGGVGFADRVFYPNVVSKELKKIEVIKPYENGSSGIEEWYIQHLGGDTIIYTVEYTPDGQGGTYFSVQKQ